MLRNFHLRTQINFTRETNVLKVTRERKSWTPF